MRFTGNGSPQGVIGASPGSTYLDVATGHFWCKATGTDANGWIQLL